MIPSACRILRILGEYVRCYREVRTRQSLHDNAPIPGTVEPPESARAVAIPQVGGLHHEYRRAT